MIAKLVYRKANRVKLQEYCIPWADVWNCNYANTFKDFYNEHKDVYKVTESNLGLIVSIPAELAGEITCAEIDVGTVKSKMRLKEVFDKCYTESTGLSS